MFLGTFLKVAILRSQLQKMDHFKGKQFYKDVIIVAVGYYLRYNLNYREVKEILYDRGNDVCHNISPSNWITHYIVI